MQNLRTKKAKRKNNPYYTQR